MASRVTHTTLWWILRASSCELVFGDIDGLRGQEFENLRLIVIILRTRLPCDVWLFLVSCDVIPSGHIRSFRRRGNVLKVAEQSVLVCQLGRLGARTLPATTALQDMSLLALLHQSLKFDLIIIGQQGCRHKQRRSPQCVAEIWILLFYSNRLGLKTAMQPILIFSSSFERSARVCLHFILLFCLKQGARLALW